MVRLRFELWTCFKVCLGMWRHMAAFFDYRKYLNLGETDLAFFDPYINYLMNYLSEKALDSAQNYFKNTFW